MSLSPISPTNNRNDDMSASLIARLQRRLNDLSSQQEKLVENREQLLVDRESVCMNRKTIAEQRTRTANTEIACLNALRKHFHDLERPLPNDLIIAYDEVEKHHLRLRTLEEEYLQAEESLGASEWTFSEQESDFYQHQLEILLSEELDEDGVEYRPIEVIRTRTPIDAITPTRSVHYQAVLADHDRLVKRFDALRKQQTLRMDTFTGDSWTRLAEDVKMDHEAMQLAGDLLDLIARCEVRLQQLRPCLDTSASVMLRKKRQASEPVFDCNGSYEHIEPISCAKSEGGVQPHDDSLHAGGDITGWSLESLKSNALEKLQYLNVLRSKMKHTELLEEDFEYWEPLVTRTWAGEYGEWQTPPERDLPAAPGCLERETKLSAVERDWDENSVAKLHVSDSHMSSPACKYDTASDCRDKTVQIISSHAYATTHSRDITSDVEREIVRCRTSQYDAGSLPVSITTLQNIVEPAGQSMMLQDCRNQLSEASMDIKLQSVSNKPHKDCHIAAAKKSNAVGEWSFLMLFFGRMISSATEYIPWTWAPLLLLHECLSLEKGKEIFLTLAPLITGSWRKQLAWGYLKSSGIRC
jgi:hypothetical protein